VRFAYEKLFKTGDVEVGIEAARGFVDGHFL
jgi:hypothetical protein